MNVSCVTCQTNMVPMETKAHEKLQTAKTLYRCDTCSICICIIDNLEETKQQLRDLLILVGTETEE